jgi:hypothetical protein
LILTKFITNNDDIVDFCDEPVNVPPDGNPFPAYGKLAKISACACVSSITNHLSLVDYRSRT